MSDLLLKSKLLFKVLSIFGVISILICLSSITILHIVNYLWDYALNAFEQYPFSE